ncbi:MAG TPA: AsmA-like C-terminal region-containing protein [Gemmatimonadales bacterium]|nr:AsmA-like C-terminal region-containing protein [Gemmatimonadales bacterium]
MKRPTRILAAVGAVILLLLALLLVLPLLFRDRIAQRAKLEANRNLDARVDWRDVGLTFFRDFPNLTLTLDDLTAAGVGRFQGDTLAAVRHLRVVLDLASVLGNLTAGRPIVVRAVELEQPRLSLIALEDGTANWDITKKTPASAHEAASKPMAISLRRFEISNGAVAFDNRKAKLKAWLSGYDQSLSGDFSRDLVGIRTKADADTVSVTFAGIPYLNRVALGLTADVQADLAKKSYSLKDTELRLNDLRLGVSGSARTAGTNLGLDLAFTAPSTNFRSILSLVPAVYAHDFEKVKTAGTFAVNGQVKGEYGDSAFPSFALNAKVNNAAFQYPDLPLPARDIAMDLSLTNPGGSADSTLVKLDRFHLLVGRNPVDARMVLRTPVSDPDLDLRVKGKVDLADVGRTLKLEGIDQLAGTVAADALVRTRMSFIDKKQYDKVAASGSVDVGNLTVKGEALPKPLAIRQASLRLAPERAELRSFNGTIGSSDLSASGSLENLLAFVMRGDTLRGTATVTSNRFNLDEWRSGEGDLQIIPVPPKIDFGLNATVAELTYDKLKMSNARGRLRVKDQRVTLEDFRMNTLGGEIGVTGFYETTTPSRPAFDVGLKLTKLDIPSAFQAFTTVQALAPVAKYAVGKFSTDLHLNGALGKNMMPLFPALSGKGSLQTSEVVLKDFPALEKVVDVTKLRFLDNPALDALRAAFQIRDGRLFVQPFDVKLGGTTMTVSGSNGFDQSLQYTLGLEVPRSMLGGEANQAIAGLVSKAGQAGVDLSAAPRIPLAIQLGGTVTNPSVKADVGTLTSSVAKGAEQAVKQAVTQKVDTAAARLVAQAEQKAAAIRQEAQTLSEKVKGEGYQQADALTAKATNPLLKAAAAPAADQLRKQADSKAADIVREANQRADSLVAQARRQAGQAPGAK